MSRRPAPASAPMSVLFLMKELQREDANLAASYERVMSVEAEQQQQERRVTALRQALALLTEAFGDEADS